MCGRITRTSPRGAIAREFGVTRFVDAELPPRYNIAPSQPLETIIRADAELRLGVMRWGFATPKDKRPKAALAPINARAETVATHPLFREAFRRRRCLVVADGFYEWRKDAAGKTPHFIHLRSDAPLGLAGIWCFDHSAGGVRVPTCAILTCSPNELMAEIHNRMPVILPATARDRWLDPEADSDELQHLLLPLPSAEMDAYPVSTLVNSARNDTPECLRPI